jgi:protein gp37
MKQAHRFSGKGKAYEGLTKMTKGGPVWTGEVKILDTFEALSQPLSCKRPRRVFVNSMSDLFHEDVPDYFIDKVFAVMAMAPRHTFQILTKRPRRMRDYVTEGGRASEIVSLVRDDELGYFCGGEKSPPISWPLPNVWLGISAEDQRRFDERWQYFCGSEFYGWPLWLSAEPLLEGIDIRAAMPNKLWKGLDSWRGGELKWVVAGGESGPGARPMHPDWARSLRDQCAAAGVPYFFKQWGTWVDEAQMLPDGSNVVERYMIDEDGCPGAFHDWPQGGFSVRIGKRAAGRYLDGRTHDEYPR